MENALAIISPLLGQSLIFISIATSRSSPCLRHLVPSWIATSGVSKFHPALNSYGSNTALGMSGGFIPCLVHLYRSFALLEFFMSVCFFAEMSSVRFLDRRHYFRNSSTYLKIQDLSAIFIPTKLPSCSHEIIICQNINIINFFFLLFLE